MELEDRVAFAITREKRKTGLSWSALAKILGTNKNTVADYANTKARGQILGVVIQKLASVYEYSSDWLLKGEGEPFPGAREKHPDVCGPPLIYNGMEQPEGEGAYNYLHLAVEEGSTQYAEGQLEKPRPDPYRRASADLLEIYNYGDGEIITAIQANLATFLRTVRTDRQITQQNDKIRKLEGENAVLKAENAEMKETISALAKRISALEAKPSEYDPVKDPAEEHGEKKAA